MVALAVPVSVRPMSTACSCSSEFSQMKFCRKFKEMTWLGFLEAFRTFCLAAPVEIRAFLKEVRVPEFAVLQP